ncbi:MAG: pyridoxamine 5'-phosphate oxidase family protein [Chloroflexi bacterium]|nr:pyridoxamine 5'-phosphate oxidase family protein [Chloroflexota bacterium]
MRRSDKEITDRAEIEDILNRAVVCHLGLCDNGIPYVVPVNYGYADGCLYIHSAKEGRKIDILRNNSNVSFTIYTDENLFRSEMACNWTMKYSSVMGTGRASLIEGRTEKEEALRCIMQHYTETNLDFNPAKVDKVVIIKIEIDTLTGKKSG